MSPEQTPRTTPQTTLAPEFPLPTRHHRLSLTPVVPWRQREASHFQSRFRSRRCLCSLYATRTLRAMIKRRSAIEPTIGHMKMDGRLGRNPLKGAIGDALHAVLCGAGHNIRMLLRKLRLLCARLGLDLGAILARLQATSQLQTQQVG